MQKHEIMQTAEGQTALFLYQKWMKANNKPVTNPKAFITSRYFNSFIKFVKFVKKVKIPNTDLYIDIMVKREIQPALWTRDEFYALYIERVDLDLTVKEQANITIGTLFDIAEAAECEVSEVFDFIDVPELMVLLRQRRLSPWLLLNSQKFLRFLGKLSDEQYILLETFIRPDFWRKKFENNPNSCALMKKYIKEIGL